MANHWYAFYPGDYGRDTAHLSLIEDGAYRRLLDHYYSTGHSLPESVDQLFRVCRAFSADEQAAVRSVLGQFFVQQSDGWHNTRVDRELVKQAEYRAKLSEGARKTNLKRWGQSTSDSPSESPSGRKPQPQPQKNKNTLAPEGACERIYQAYPRKVGKAAALKAINKAIAAIQKEKATTLADSADFLYSQVVGFAASPVGQRGRYTPHCSSWMNAGRYFDDPAEWHTVTTGEGQLSDSQFLGTTTRRPECPVGFCDGTGQFMDRATRRLMDCECQKLRGSTTQ